MMTSLQYACKINKNSTLLTRYTQNDRERTIKLSKIGLPIWCYLDHKELVILLKITNSRLFICSPNNQQKVIKIKNIPVRLHKCSEND